MNLQAVIEGLLFLSGDEGVTIAQLQGCIDDVFPQEIEEQLEKIAQSCQDECRGFELVHFAGKYKFVSKEELYKIAKEYCKNNQKIYKKTIEEAKNFIYEIPEDTACFIVGSFYVYSDWLNL